MNTRLDLRKPRSKGFSQWSVALEEDAVVTWTDSDGPVRKRHGEPWKAANEMQREVRKRMLSGFFFLRPAAEADRGDAIYEGAFKHAAEVFDFHPSGASIAVAQTHQDARGAEICIVDIPTGERRTVLTLAEHPGLPGSETLLHTLRFDPSGERIHVALGDEVWALTVANGQMMRLTSPWEALPGQTDERFGGARYFADRPSLARSDRRRRRWIAQDGGDLVVRDEHGGTLLRRDCRLHPAHEYRCARVSPSGRLLALQARGRESGKPNELELWSVDEGRLLRRLDLSRHAPRDAPYNLVEQMVFTGDETSVWFTFLSGDRGMHSVPVDGSTPPVDLSSLVYEQPRRDACGRFDEPLLDLALADDGQVLVVATQGGVRFVELPTGRVIHSVEEELTRVRSLSLSDDGRCIASGSANGRLVVRKASGGPAARLA